MRKRENKDKQASESLFERWLNQERRKKLAQHEGLFFGLCVLFALYATQSMFNI